MSCARNWTALIILLACYLVPGAAGAQTPDFQPLMPGDRVVASAAVDGRVYAGLARGGVIEWDPESEQVLRHLDRASGLGGHYVQGMAWSGSRLLVAFADGGITAIASPGTPDEFMQLYRDGLSSLDVTCVAGQQIGGSERIYYGTDGEGIGLIEGGREGAYLSTLDGLLHDTVTGIALSGDLLLVAVESGWSRFADNVFTSWDYATSGMDTIHDLEVASDGSIWAATSDGVKRWDDDGEAWANVFGAGRYIDLARDGDAMLAVRSADILVRIAGSGLTVPVPQAPENRGLNVSTAVSVGGELWVGGNVFRTDQGGGSRAARGWLGRAGVADAPLLTLPICPIGVDGGFDGAAVDLANRVWVGDRSGDGLAGWDGRQWYNVDRRATAENDSAGLWDFGGGLLAMARSGDDLYFNQYTKGLIRFRPAAEPGGQEQWTHLTRDNSPMLVDGIIAIGGHPDGAVLICSDAANWWGGANNALLGVDVLIDPERPFLEESWHHVYPADLGGNAILAVHVERRDVIWFSVQGLGLRRWDLNGPTRGPDDPLTWRDTSDDDWSETIADPGGGTLDFAAVNAIAVGPDGDIWAGGSGLARFTYSAALDLVTFGAEYQRKLETFIPGLLGQVIQGLAFDRNQDLWVLSDAGLNRLRFGAEGVSVDAYTDLVSFGGLDQRFYSPSAITALPGGTYRELAVATDGSRLVLTSDLGASMVEVPRRGAASGEAADLSYLYPNPFPGDGAASLNVGGLEVDADQPVSIEVLNLAGQLVFRSRNVVQAEAVWDGRNRQGERVASGLYVVKITQGGATRVRTLAVAF
jgi:hypothetical protein